VIEMYVVLVVALLTAGAGMGILAVVSLGIRREEAAARHLTTGNAGRTVYAARVVTCGCGRIAADGSPAKPSPGARRDSVAGAAGR
jgi:hypothetical protein